MALLGFACPYIEPMLGECDELNELYFISCNRCYSFLITQKNKNFKILFMEIEIGLPKSVGAYNLCFLHCRGV